MPGPQWNTSRDHVCEFYLVKSHGLNVCGRCGAQKPEPKPISKPAPKSEPVRR